MKIIFLLLFLFINITSHPTHFEDLKPSNDEDKLKKLEESILANQTDIPLIKPILFGFGNYSRESNGDIVILAYLKKAKRYIPKLYFGFNAKITYKGYQKLPENNAEIFVKGILQERSEGNNMFLIYRIIILQKVRKEIERIDSVGNYQISDDPEMKSNLELNDVAKSALLKQDNLQDQKDDLNKVIKKIVFFQNTELKYDLEYWFSFAGDLSEKLELKEPKNIVEIIFTGERKKLKCILTNITDIRYNISCYAKKSVYDRFSGGYIDITKYLKNPKETLLMVDTEEEEDLVYIEHYVHDEKRALERRLDIKLSNGAVFGIIISCFIIVGTSAFYFNKNEDTNVVSY